MARGPLFEKNYRPQFSGHETFPLRYGWLKKAFDAIEATEPESDNKSVFLSEDAIARFGVGKNMVASIRHWATAAGIIEESNSSRSIHMTDFGRKFFADSGFDPYMEHPETLWLVHWQLSARSEKTTWFWAFNHYPAVTFEREQLANSLERIVKEQGWSRVSGSTIKNDVACFIRTYVANQASRQTGHEDTLESPLTELGLIKSIGKKDGFRFVRGPKSTLGNGVFLYALIRFWLSHSNASTLSFEAIAHAPGSPGCVFLLDENDVVDRLGVLDDLTDGEFRWSETAGLKQVIRSVELSRDAALRYVEIDYDEVVRPEAA